MILVTGAAGKTGQALIRALAGQGKAVRALVHHPRQAQTVRQAGAADVAVGDMYSPAAMGAAAQGARAVYHICPNVSPGEIEIGQIAIKAARAAGIQHFVYHSVLHPQVQDMPHHWLKMRVEERLFESGLDYTIMQPAAYMQNVLAHRERIVEEGIYPVPYAAGTRLGMVDLEDVAMAAARILTELGHAAATYELAGPEVLTQIEIADILEQQLGRRVQVQPMLHAEWEGLARAAGLDDYRIETLLKMFRYYEQHGFWGNPNVLSRLLERPPRTFSELVAREFPARDKG